MTTVWMLTAPQRKDPDKGCVKSSSKDRLPFWLHQVSRDHEMNLKVTLLCHPTCPSGLQSSREHWGHVFRLTPAIRRDPIILNFKEKLRVFPACHANAGPCVQSLDEAVRLTWLKRVLYLGRCTEHALAVWRRPTIADKWVTEITGYVQPSSVSRRGGLRNKGREIRESTWQLPSRKE